MDVVLGYQRSAGQHARVIFILDYAFRNSLIVLRSPATREDRARIEAEKQLVLLDPESRLDCRLLIFVVRGRTYFFHAVGQP